MNDQNLKHICGRCNASFETEAEYCDHLCPETGFTPKEPEHLGAEFVAISQAALERGQARKDLEAKGVDPEEAKVRTKDLGVEVK